MSEDAIIVPATMMLYVVVSLLLGSIVSVEAWQSCPLEAGGGVCPDNNVCCKTRTLGVSSCITEKAKPHNGTGVCCQDNGITGCGPGYTCATATEDNGSIRSYCQLSLEDPDDPHQLPRYKLCSPTEESLDLRGLDLAAGGKLAYFSSLGSLTGNNLLDRHQRVTHVLIVIHGSGRNADDYLCCGLSSVPTQMKDSTLVIAPWFLAPEDGQQHISNLLRWHEDGPIPHTWRYGAEAASDNMTSSFSVMDQLIESLLIDNHRFSALESIMVAGHSAGGQFTHRWALTSNSSVWKQRQVQIRVIAANPRSFCYLDEQRYNHRDGTFQIPAVDMIDACPGYNAWTWGLEMDGRVPGPDYVAEQITEGGASLFATNYAERKVIYLAGALDTLPVQSECEDDDFQGRVRFERSKIYFDYLRRFYRKPTHHRLEAEGVPHDHCLMFQSPAGQAALFSDLFSPQDVVVPV